MQALPVGNGRLGAMVFGNPNHERIQLNEDFGNLGVLGELSDPLLDRTLTYISTGSKGFTKNKDLNLKEIYNSKLATPTSNNMYGKLYN